MSCTLTKRADHRGRHVVTADVPQKEGNEVEVVDGDRLGNHAGYVVPRTVRIHAVHVSIALGSMLFLLSSPRIFHKIHKFVIIKKLAFFLILINVSLTLDKYFRK